MEELGALLMESLQFDTCLLPRRLGDDDDDLREMNGDDVHH